MRAKEMEREEGEEEGWPGSSGLVMN